MLRHGNGNPISGQVDSLMDRQLISRISNSRPFDQKLKDFVRPQRKLHTGVVIEDETDEIMAILEQERPQGDLQVIRPRPKVDRLARSFAVPFRSDHACFVV